MDHSKYNCDGGGLLNLACNKDQFMVKRSAILGRSPPEWRTNRLDVHIVEWGRSYSWGSGETSTLSNESSRAKHALTIFWYVNGIELFGGDAPKAVNFLDVYCIATPCFIFLQKCNTQIKNTFKMRGNHERNQLSFFGVSFSAAGGVSATDSLD